MLQLAANTVQTLQNSVVELNAVQIEQCSVSGWPQQNNALQISTMLNSVLESVWLAGWLAGASYSLLSQGGACTSSICQKGVMTTMMTIMVMVMVVIIVVIMVVMIVRL